MRFGIANAFGGFVFSKPLIRQRLQECDESGSVLLRELQAVVTEVLGEVRVEGRTAFEAVVIVVDDFFQGGKTTVMHVGRCEGDVTQTGDDEFAFVGWFAGDFGEPFILQRGFVIEAVVQELVIREVSSTVAVETVGTADSACRIAFSEEELETALLLLGEAASPGEGLIHG